MFCALRQAFGFFFFLFTDTDFVVISPIDAYICSEEIVAPKRK